MPFVIDSFYVVHEATLQSLNNGEHVITRCNVGKTHQPTVTHSYQDTVTMGTNCSSKPLMGLELNLSVHIVYMKILIT